MRPGIYYNINRLGILLPFVTCIRKGFIRRIRGIFVGGKSGLKAALNSQQTLTTTTYKEVAMAKRTIPKSSDRNDFQSALTAFSERRVK